MSADDSDWPVQGDGPTVTERFTREFGPATWRETIRRIQRQVFGDGLLRSTRRRPGGYPGSGMKHEEGSMAITREEQYRAPADKIAGTYIQPPRGIILHGSRSSRSVSLAEEYRGTAAWAISNPGGLCWAVTVGPNIYAPHLTAREWGWHAREHSDEYLGCEFAQPTVNHAITADQIATFVEWYLRDVQPMWPRLTLATDDQMPMHSELPAGIRDGKTDAFPKGDVRAHELRQRIRAELARRQGTRFRVLPGMLAAMRRNKDEPASDEVELRPGYTIATGRKGTYIWSEATDFVTFTPRV